MSTQERSSAFFLIFSLVSVVSYQYALRILHSWMFSAYIRLPGQRHEDRLFDYYLISLFLMANYFNSDIACRYPLILPPKVSFFSPSLLVNLGLIIEYLVHL